VKLGLLALRIDQPVFANTSLLVFAELISAVAADVAGADDLDRQIGGALEMVFLESLFVGLGDEENVGRSAGQIRAGLHLEWFVSNKCKALLIHKRPHQCQKEPANV